MYLSVIYLLIISISGSLCITKKYENYSLYRVVPVNESHMDFFTSLQKRFDVNFWREPGLMYKPIDFVINPRDQDTFVKEAKRRGVFYTKVMDDVQRAFNKQTVMTYVRRQHTSMNWLNYYRLEDIYEWMRDLTKEYPKAVTLRTIGETYQKRKILALRVLLPRYTKRPVGKAVPSTVIIEGGIHAREWISPAFVTYLINAIVQADKSSDAALRTIAYHYEWYFVPVLNPDGYEYTHTDDRQWRKNRNGNGVDLNRNFDHAHGTSGISWDSTDESYCGPSPFSEPETFAMKNFINTVKGRLKYYLSFHSYGQYIIIPYANSKAHKDNYDEVYAMCRTAGKKISARYKTKYEIGTAFETVGYAGSGWNTDWVKKTILVPYVMTFELRDSGTRGFALPPEQIIPTCEETLDGIKSLLEPKDQNLTENPRKSCGQPYNDLYRIVALVNVILSIACLD